jgi:hypothetical protein
MGTLQYGTKRLVLYKWLKKYTFNVRMWVDAQKLC